MFIEVAFSLELRGWQARVCYAQGEELCATPHKGIGRA
jgi:hypothetical protein